MTKDKQRVLQFRDRMAEESLELSDAEVKAGVADEGEDPIAVAARMRSSLNALLVKAGKERMSAAKAEFNERAGKPVASRVKDWAPAKVRAAVERAVKREDAPRQLTLQYREGKVQSEAELLSLAEDLAALGLLDDET